VHLHSGGGAKLLDKIAQVMADDKKSLSALNTTNKESVSLALDRFRSATRQEAMRKLKESPAL
jgi:hypothetical protein